MKKFVTILLLAILPFSVSAVSTRDTNMDIMDNGQGLYGKTAAGVEKHCIGINSSDKVEIDANGLGITLTGAPTITGATTFTSSAAVGTFLKVTNSTTASPSAATNATLTAVGTRQIIAGAAAISTINVVATTNVATGTIIIFKTNDSTKDAVFIETGNLVLGAATRTLSDVADRLAVMYDAVTNRWHELFFADNN